MIKGTITAVVTAGLLAILFSGQQSFAQYPIVGSNDIGVGGISNATLEKCTQLNIDRNQCSDSSVLLKERVVAAKAASNGGSGTAMIATQVGQLTLFLVALGIVFGGVAAAFFVSGRRQNGRIEV